MNNAQLEAENESLRGELAQAQTERDDWKETAARRSRWVEAAWHRIQAEATVESLRGERDKARETLQEQLKWCSGCNDAMDEDDDDGPLCYVCMIPYKETEARLQQAEQALIEATRFVQELYENQGLRDEEVEAFLQARNSS